MGITSKFATGGGGCPLANQSMISMDYDTDMYGYEWMDNGWMDGWED